MIIDGKAIAQEIEDEIAREVSTLKGRPPSLTVVIVGHDPASHIYVNRKKAACERVGINSQKMELSDTTSEAELLQVIKELNADSTVDGILVQLPLPKQINPLKVIEAIDPKKDVDGFHPENSGKLLCGDSSAFIPCTPLGILELMKRSNIQTSGASAVVVGRSDIVGKPMAALLMQRGVDATVTVAHSKTKDLFALCKTADILIAAIGRAEFIGEDAVKEGAVVIDVGMNRVDDPSAKKGYRLVGDVAYKAVKDKCQAITPVPGGVGPMTITMLLQNTLQSYRQCV